MQYTITLTHMHIYKEQYAHKKHLILTQTQPCTYALHFPSHRSKTIWQIQGLLSDTDTALISKLFYWMRN